MNALWLFFTLFTARHDFHTSLTEMRVNAKEKTVEVTVRVFTDDFENALTRANANQRVRLEAKDRHDPLIDRYLKQRFTLTNASGKPKPFRYLGKEFEADATWLYLEFPLTEPLLGAKLQQLVLLDLFDDQTNLVNVFYGGDEKRSFLFNQKTKVHQL
jgi:hypothetical protein